MFYVTPIEVGFGSINKRETKMNNSPLESVFHAYRKAGSVEALAKELDVSEQSVDNWLNMRTRPQRSILESIIDYATRKP